MSAQGVSCCVLMAAVLQLGVEPRTELWALGLCSHSPGCVPAWAWETPCAVPYPLGTLQAPHAGCASLPEHQAGPTVSSR